MKKRFIVCKGIPVPAAGVAHIYLKDAEAGRLTYTFSESEAKRFGLLHALLVSFRIGSANLQFSPSQS